MESTWPAACSTGETLSPRMSMPLLPPSRPRGQSSSLTGVQQDSRLESITSLQLLFLAEISPKFKEPFACFPTPPLSPKPGPDLTTSLISCTPRELLSTGMLERAWKRESSLKPERTWLLLRKITKRLAWTVWKLKAKEERNTKHPPPYIEWCNSYTSLSRYQTNKIVL